MAGQFSASVNNADFRGLVERAKKKKWTVEVWFWGNAAHDMKAAATFVDLDKALDYLRKGGGVALPPAL